MKISFSGLDGSGKTTQITYLMNFFKANGLKSGSIYDYTSDIRYHHFLDLAMFYSKLKDKDIIHTRFRLNFDENNELMNIIEFSNFDIPYLAEATALQDYHDAIQLEKYMNQPLSKKAEVMIYDRYFYDEIAFKSVFGCSYNRMNRMYEDYCQLDFSFYIKVSPETIYRRNQTRKDSSTTIYKDMRYIRLLSSYFDQVAKDYHMITLDGELPENVLHEIILGHLYK